MKIVLFGASGMIGQRILREALQRGHEVTAVARDISRIPKEGSGQQDVAGDVLDSTEVAKIAAGHDVAITAFGPSQGAPDLLVQAAHSLIAGLTQAGISRLVIVGGAGSLEVAPGVQLVDTPQFPEAWKGLALAHRDALDVYRNEANALEWSYLSPAALIQPGERTGKFRVGGNELLTDAQGNSQISAEDFAIAILNEVETPEHIRQRFSVAY